MILQWFGLEWPVKYLVYGDPSGVFALGITQCRVIEPKKDDGHVSLQDVREWQQDDQNIQDAWYLLR